MRKCFLYSRVSSKKQKDGDGLARQKNLLENFLLQNAERLNLSTDGYEFICDLGRSAWKGQQMDENAALGAFFKRVELGELNGCALLCESLDRFSRENPFTCIGYLARLSEHNVDLIDVTKNLVISRSDPTSLTMATIYAQRAYEESTLKSQRIKSAWTARRVNAKENGTYMISNTPFWISVDEQQMKYVFNKNVEIVQEVYRLYLDGYGSYTIARKMNDAGKVIKGKRWSTPKICALLRNPRCKGDFISSSLERDYHMNTSEIVEEVITGLYPSVVTASEFALVEAKLATHNKRGRVRDDRKMTVLNGLLKCSGCGEAFTLRTVGKYRYVGCLKSIEKDKSCTSRAIRYELIEKAVIEHAKNLDFKIIYEGNHSKADVIRERIADLTLHIEQFNTGIANLKVKGKKPSFDMLNEVQESEDELNLLNDKLAECLSILELEEFKVDDRIYDIKNVAMRGRIELALSRLLNKIKVYSLMGVDFFIIDISYYSGVLSHTLVINRKTGDVLGSIAVSNNGDSITYETRTIKIIQRGESVERICTHKEELNDYLFLLNTADFIEGSECVRDYLRENLGSILPPLTK